MSKTLRTVGVIAGAVALIASGAGALAGAGLISATGVGGASFAAIASTAAIASPVATQGVQLETKPMTAINLFLDHRQAYVVTDQGHFTPDGIIGALGSKTITFAALPMTVSFFGRHRPVELMEELDALLPLPRVDSFLAAMPQALRRLRARIALAHPEAEGTPLNDVGLWIASYDRDRRAPGIHMTTSYRLASHPQHKPYTLVDLDPGYVAPAVDLAKLLPRGYVDQPRRDGWRILQAQRRFTFGPHGGGCRVAGAGELYTVGAQGVTVQAIGRFPEQVGERADPTRLGCKVADRPFSLAAA